VIEQQIVAAVAEKQGSGEIKQHVEIKQEKVFEKPSRSVSDSNSAKFQQQAPASILESQPSKKSGSRRSGNSNNNNNNNSTNNNNNNNNTNNTNNVISSSNNGGSNGSQRRKKV
jgi:Mg-chelatase subunit ChlI